MATAYTFTTEKPLTAAQLQFINDALTNLPFEDKVNMSDCPVWVSDVDRIADQSAG